MCYELYSYFSNPTLKIILMVFSKKNLVLGNWGGFDIGNQMFLLLGICFKSFLVFQAGQNGPLIKVTWNENGKLKDLMVIIYCSSKI